MPVKKLHDVMLERNKCNDMSYNSWGLRKKRAEMITSIHPETLSNEPHFRVLELACPKYPYFLIPGKSQFKFIKQPLQFPTYNSRKFEEVIKLNPPLRQVEAARPTPISSTDTFDKIEQREARLVVFSPVMPRKIYRSCPRRICTLAIPRQNRMEVRRREIEQNNKIYMVSKSAMKAKPSARLLELAKPKNIHEISVKTMQDMSKSAQKAMPSSKLFEIPKPRRVEIEKSEYKIKEKHKILKRTKQKISTPDNFTDISVEEETPSPSIEDSSLQESLSYILLSESLSDVLEGIEITSLSSIEEQNETLTETTESKEEIDQLLLLQDIEEEQVTEEEIIEDENENVIEINIIEEGSDKGEKNEGIIELKDKKAIKEKEETQKVNGKLEETEEIRKEETKKEESPEIKEKIDIGKEETTEIKEQIHVEEKETVEEETISSGKQKSEASDELEEMELEPPPAKSTRFKRRMSFVHLPQLSTQIVKELDHTVTEVISEISEPTLADNEEKSEIEEKSGIRKEETVESEQQNQIEDEKERCVRIDETQDTGKEKSAENEEYEEMELEPPPARATRYKRRMSFVHLPQLSMHTVKELDHLVTEAIPEISEPSSTGKVEKSEEKSDIKKEDTMHSEQQDQIKDKVEENEEFEEMELEPPPAKSTKHKRRMSFIHLPQLSMQAMKELHIITIPEISEPEEK